MMVSGTGNLALSEGIEIIPGFQSKGDSAFQPKRVTVWSCVSRRLPSAAGEVDEEENTTDLIISQMIGYFNNSERYAHR
jgi:hypothetical protein